MSLFSNIWASNVSSEVVEPTSDQQDQGFSRSNPGNYGWLNWLFKEITGLLNTWFTAWEAEHNTNGTHKTINATAINVGGGSGGSGATIDTSGNAAFDGELTHKAATNYIQRGASFIARLIDPTDIGAPTDWTLTTESSYKYISRDIAVAAQSGFVVPLDLPTGAILTSVVVRYIRPTGSGVGGSISLALTHTKNSLTETVEDVDSWSLSQPATEGAVMLNTHTVTLPTNSTTVSSVSDIHLHVLIPGLARVGLINVRVAYTLTRPGAF